MTGFEPQTSGVGSNSLSHSHCQYKLHFSIKMFPADMPIAN